MGFIGEAGKMGMSNERVWKLVSPGDSVIVATVYRDSISWMSDARRGMTAVVIGPVERGVSHLEYHTCRLDFFVGFGLYSLVWWSLC